MKILVNTSGAVLGGAVTHLRHLLPYLARQACGDEILVVANAHGFEQLGRLGEGIHPVSVEAEFGNPARRLVWENRTLPKIATELGADVILHPANVPLLRCPTPQVCIVHNVAPFLDQIAKEETLYQRFRLRMLRQLTALSLQRSTASIFLSHWTRERVLSSLGLVGRRFPVIYFGADQPSLDPDPSLLRRLDLKAGEYILSVSHFYRYKRIEHLIAAFKAPELRATGTSLVLVGAHVDRAYAERLRGMTSTIGARVLFTGPLDPRGVLTLMASCRVFVFTSIAENLPITLLEAMRQGAPIVTNRSCSMPEVCGEAAAYVTEPTPSNYAREISGLLTDREEARERSAKSLARARRFRWQEAARRTLQVLREAAHGRQADVDSRLSSASLAPSEHPPGPRAR